MLVPSPYGRSRRRGLTSILQRLQRRKRRIRRKRSHFHHTQGRGNSRAPGPRDIVLGGVWPRELGKDYSFLHRLRKAGDYGGEAHVSEESAKKATEAADRILAAVRGSLLPGE